MQLLHTISKERSYPGNTMTEPLQSSSPHLLIGPFRYHQTDLPGFRTIEREHNVSSHQVSERLLRILRLARQAKPEDIHQRRCLHWFKTRQLTHTRETPVGTNCQYRAYLIIAINAP